MIYYKNNIEISDIIDISNDDDDEDDDDIDNDKYTKEYFFERLKKNILILNYYGMKDVQSLI